MLARKMCNDYFFIRGDPLATTYGRNHRAYRTSFWNGYSLL